MTKQPEIDFDAVTEAAVRHGALLDVGNAFQGGPFDERDLRHLALISSAFDAELMVDDIRKGNRPDSIKTLRTLAAMMWATGFKTGIDSAPQKGTP